MIVGKATVLSIRIRVRVVDTFTCIHDACVHVPTAYMYPQQPFVPSGLFTSIERQNISSPMVTAYQSLMQEPHCKHNQA
jgi:hypothetical protein